MNHTSQRLKAHKAVQGFLQAKAAEALSPRTLAGYADTLNQWLEYTGQAEVRKIKAQDIRAFLAYLRTDYVPRRLSGKTHPLSAKTIRNVYIPLASLFTWLGQEFHLDNPVKGCQPPTTACGVSAPGSAPSSRGLWPA